MLNYQQIADKVFGKEISMPKIKTILFVILFLILVLVFGIANSQEKISNELVLGATVTVIFKDVDNLQKEKIIAVISRHPGNENIKYLDMKMSDDVGQITFKNVPHGDFEISIFAVGCVVPFDFSIYNLTETVRFQINVKKCTLANVAHSLITDAPH